MKWETVRRGREILAAEQGAIVRDWGGRLPIALVYPNSYHVGMSSLGLQTLYGLLNAQPGIVAERVFWTASEPSFSIETQQPLQGFAVLAVSLSFELDLLHLVELLRSADLPVLAEERGEDAPLVVVGGPVATANPELLAPLVDAAFVGEAEGSIAGLAEALVATASEPRSARRRALSRLPGLYVPGESPVPVQRVLVKDLDAYPVHSVILTPDTEFGEMYLIEVARGCKRGCRFCLAGAVYRPLRQRSVPVILAQAAEGLRYRRTLGLVGAAVSDYEGIDELLAGLRNLGVQIAVSSLRVDPLPESLLDALAASGTQTLTVAPEAGSDRLRRLISKGVTREHILSAAERANAHNFPQLKLYFMLGLPGETDDDIQAIASLTREVKARFRRRVTVNVTPFVPKPHTPFQREAMTDAATIDGRIRLLTRELRAIGVEFRGEGVAWAEVQGVLARGDATLGRALAQLPAPTLAGWRKMLKRAEIDPAAYLGARPAGAPLPWDVVDERAACGGGAGAAGTPCGSKDGAAC